MTVLPACWVDGKRVDLGAPHVSALDRGFTLADGLFETMRAYSGAIFRFNAHMARLSRGAERLGFPRPAHMVEMLAEAQKELRASALDAIVRLTVTRGPGVHGLGVVRGVGQPTVVLLAQGLSTPPMSISLRTASGRRNERSMTAGIKTLSYTENIVAVMEATEAGAEDAVFLDTEGHVAEATSSNIFVVKDGVVRTPPTSCGAFPGITRETVLELLRAMKDEALSLGDGPISAEELAAADEVFLTSSVREITPVDALDGRSLTAPGPVTTAVIGAYQARVQIERES